MEQFICYRNANPVEKEFEIKVPGAPIGPQIGDKIWLNIDGRGDLAGMWVVEEREWSLSSDFHGLNIWLEREGS